VGQACKSLAIALILCATVFAVFEDPAPRGGAAQIDAPGKLSQTAANAGTPGRAVQRSPKISPAEHYTGNVDWMDASGGVVPPGAVQGGQEAPPEFEALYVCRASFNNSVQPGKVRPGFGACEIPYGGAAFRVPRYQVLVGTGSRWVPAGAGYIPGRPVLAGYDIPPESPQLFICQASYKGGIHPGKITSGWIGCHITWAGREILVPAYNVLVVEADPPSPQAKSLEKGSVDCAKVTSLANSGLKSIFGPNYSGSWVPAIINFAKGASGVGNVFQNILRDNPGANNSIGQLIAAFLASSQGGYLELTGVGGTTLNALLLGLALEQPQSGIDDNIARALYEHYGFDAGHTALRNLQQGVIDALSDAAGQQSQQIRVMLQANLGASGKICTN
jgi:hypothetical protein